MTPINHFLAHSFLFWHLCRDQTQERTRRGVAFMGAQKGAVRGPRGMTLWARKPCCSSILLINHPIYSTESVKQTRGQNRWGPTGGTAATCKCGRRGSSPTLCPPPVHLIPHSSQGTPWKVWPKKFHVQNSVPPNLTATCGRRMPWCCNSA